MTSAALAIAWEFRHRHRWALIAAASYLVVVATIKLFILEPGQVIDTESAERFAIMVVVPLSAVVFYFLAAFCFGLDGDLAARESIYPARMFALPVTTGGLAGWPMLYGSALMLILWLAIRPFAVWPAGFEVPLIWPALLATAVLAWTQALMWMPYGLPGLRVIVAMLCLVAIDTVVLLALYYEAPESLMVAFLAPQVPFAYFVARFAVARARRGDVPDWRPIFAGLARIPDILPRRRNHFASPERAQMWFEWRRHGRSLPALVRMVLPFELALLFATDATPALVFFILFGVLLTPPFMAAFAAVSVSKANPHAGDSYGMSPFIATRPLTSAALIGAKLKMAIWSTLAAWLLVLVAIPLALELSGTLPVVMERAARLRDAVGTPRAVVFVLLLLAGFIASTWRQLVQSLFVGLTGRDWVIKANALVLLTFSLLIGPIVVWILEHKSVQAALLIQLPLILAVLMCVKMMSAAWVATRLYHSRLLGDRTLVTGAACWVVAVLALYGLLGWLVSGPLIPRYFLALCAILAIPLARVSAAPLALAWNRHR